MKRVALLCSALALFGCGGGGSSPGGGVSLDNTGTTGPAAGLAVKLIDSGTSAKTGKLTVTGGTSTLPTANKIRVVARIIKTTYPIDTYYDTASDTEVPAINYDGLAHFTDSFGINSTVFPSCGGLSPVVLDSSCNPTGAVVTASTATHHVSAGATDYKKVIDQDYTGGNLTVYLPVNDGYTLDFITSAYDAATQKNSILKMGSVTGVNVTATGGSATVAMAGIDSMVTYSPVALSNTKPDLTQITSEEKYNLTVTVSGPLKTSFTVGQSLSSALLPTASLTRGTSGSPVSFTAPTSVAPGFLYFQGVFNLDESMLKTGESVTNWTRIYPNPAYGESVYTDLLYLVGVTIP